MELTYKDFKKEVKDWGYNDKSYSIMIRDVDEFYDENSIKFFYPKNVNNEKPTELIFFLENGLLTVKRDEEKNEYIYEQLYCEIKSKTLKTTRFKNGNHTLEIEFNNGKKLIFNNLDDSNSYFESEYSQIIRELYKAI
jgi:Protein of unknown function (DUF3908)